MNHTTLGNLGPPATLLWGWRGCSQSIIKLSLQSAQHPHPTSSGSLTNETGQAHQLTTFSQWGCSTKIPTINFQQIIFRGSERQMRWHHYMTRGLGPRTLISCTLALSVREASWNRGLPHDPWPKSERGLPLWYGGWGTGWGGEADMPCQIWLDPEADEKCFSFLPV